MTVRLFGGPLDGQEIGLAPGVLHYRVPVIADMSSGVYTQKDYILSRHRGNDFVPLMVWEDVDMVGLQ